MHYNFGSVHNSTHMFETGRNWRDIGFIVKQLKKHEKKLLSTEMQEKNIQGQIQKL